MGAGSHAEISQHNLFEMNTQIDQNIYHQLVHNRRATHVALAIFRGQMILWLFLKNIRCGLNQYSPPNYPQAAHDTKPPATTVALHLFHAAMKLRFVNYGVREIFWIILNA